MIEPGIYKDVMGSFPSGVTVVTTLDADGGIVGITASAFSALSIDPALVLFWVGLLLGASTNDSPAEASTSPSKVSPLTGALELDAQGSLMKIPSPAFK